MVINKPELTPQSHAELPRPCYTTITTNFCCVASTPRHNELSFHISFFNKELRETQVEFDIIAKPARIPLPSPQFRSFSFLLSSVIPTKVGDGAAEAIVESADNF